MKANVSKVRRSVVPHISQKQTIKQYLKKFKVKFEISEKAIDLRVMSENYTAKSGIIPLEDINKLITLFVGLPPTKHDYDPSGGAIISYPNANTSPQFKYINWDEAYLWSLFQRDVIPYHIKKILADFDHSCVIVPTAIKITINGKVHYCIWDGHHTLQVCRLKGYTKFPVWFIDIDCVSQATIENAGFGSTTEDRIKYGVWLAGRNMIRINSKNKRPLSPYDEFMIQLETRDARAIKMKAILDNTGCTPKRNASMPGAFTQIKSGIECYELADKYGNEGIYWSRALQFHRNTWPAAPLGLEVFRPLSILYHEAALLGQPLDAQFDTEISTLLIKEYGDPESVQMDIKASFHNAVYHAAGSGVIPNHDRRRVLSGLINLYNQKVGRIKLPPADYIWTL